MFFAEILQFGVKRLIRYGEDRYGVERGIRSPRFADCKRGDGHALGHLNDGIEAVFAAEVFRRNRNAQNRDDAFGGEHPGQVRRTARARDDAGKAPVSGTGGVVKHFVGHPVRTHDLGFVGNAELFEYFSSFLHDGPVRRRAHHNTDYRGFVGNGHFGFPITKIGAAAFP